MNFSLTRDLSVLAILLVAIAGCKTRNNPSMIEPPAEVPPAEYGQGEGIPMPPGQEGGGRFGYTGNDAAEAPPAPGRRNDSGGGVFGGNRSDRDEVSAPPSSGSSSGGSSSSGSSSGGPPSSGQMPYANKVPGNPLVVTLPGNHSSLGQISIEKYDSSGNPTGQPLKRGTQVQIPDPNNPGKKIYFKVP